MADNYTYHNFKSPKGPFGYPWLTKPDTKFDDGTFKVTLALSQEQAEPLLEQVRQAARELGKKAKGCKVPFKKNEETGLIEFTFKSAKRPKLFKANGSPYKADEIEELRVGGGTVGRVNGAFKAYDGFGGGVTAYLNEVQIVNLVEFGSGGSFAPDEDGDDNVDPGQTYEGGFGSDESGDDEGDQDVDF